MPDQLWKLIGENGAEGKYFKAECEERLLSNQSKAACGCEELE